MRTRFHRFALGCALVVGTALLLNGCVDVQETLPAQTAGGIKVHPSGWLEPSSQNFHGRTIMAEGWDLSSCQTCHGREFSGGTSQKTCLTCHNQEDGPENCSTCHGSAVNEAPPRDTEKNTSVSARGVGAHQAHLVATSGKVLKCEECHAVPLALKDVGHIDTTLYAEVAMDDTLANKSSDGGAIIPNPTYSSSALSCSSVYCHGTFKNGNQANEPVWTDAMTGRCGTCHGDATKTTTKEKALPKSAPLGGTHPPDTQCQWCHSNINVDAVFTNVSAHVDGTIDLVNVSNDCTRCHGSGANPAPPSDLQGNTAVANRGVGAHVAHLAGTGLGLQVACAECHTVPTTTYTSGHLDTDRPAEVLFSGPLAGLQTSGVTPAPAYSAANVSCSSTYCHGTFTNGNPTNEPVWNEASGSGAVCGTCHGDVGQPTAALRALPKTASNGGTHPEWAQCQWCHSNVDASPMIVNAATHMNGELNMVTSVVGDCSRCHGTTADGAPPRDLNGGTAVTNRGVGAHQAHLVTSMGKTVQCSECHTVPTAEYQTGHFDTPGPAEVPLAGTLASHPTTGVNPNPSYSASAVNCSNTYCHGSFTNGNLSNAPTWTSTVGTGASCGSCHGDIGGSTLAEKAIPKTATNGGTHLPYTRCETCHTSVNSSLAFLDKELHVDGQVALFQLTSQADCSRCHGSGSNPAPPTDLAGNADSTSATVGAHQRHLFAANSFSVNCTECHSVPTTLVYTGADGHIDADEGAEVLFQDSLASKTTNAGAIVPNPSFNPTTLACSNTYCHGTFKNGNASNAPVWNVASTAACGTCHGDGAGNPTPGGTHTANNNCNFCHTVSGESAVATFDGTAWTITNKSRHLNGKLNLFASENDDF